MQELHLKGEDLNPPLMATYLHLYHSQTSLKFLYVRASPLHMKSPKDGLELVGHLV